MFIWLFHCAVSGVLVPGGFGVRGTEGKIQAINWARKQKKPFLGKKLCSENCRFSASGKIWCNHSNPVVKFEINLVLQVFVWACSWQCVNLLVMYSAGKVTPMQDFLICLLKHTLHVLLNLKCFNFYFNCFSINRCQFYRIWSWNQTSSGRYWFGQTNEHICIMISFFMVCWDLFV